MTNDVIADLIRNLRLTMGMLKQVQHDGTVAY
jgi:hypothetical protein